MPVAGVPSQPRIFTPSTVRALQAARGETFTFRGWKWIVVLALAVGLLALVLIGPFFFP